VARHLVPFLDLPDRNHRAELREQEVEQDEQPERAGGNGRLGQRREVRAVVVGKYGCVSVGT
jgi:hypothetical protein